MKPHLRKRSARTMLIAIMMIKDRVRARWAKIGYDRQAEFEGVISLVEELLDAILDNADLSDFRSEALLGAVSAFIDSTYWPEHAHDQEDD